MLRPEITTTKEPGKKPESRRSSPDAFRMDKPANPGLEVRRKPEAPDPIASYERAKSPTPGRKDIFYEKDDRLIFNEMKRHARVNRYAKKMSEDLQVALKSLESGDSSSSLHQHILEQRSTVDASGWQGEPADILMQEKEALKSDLKFWQKVCDIHCTFESLRDEVKFRENYYEYKLDAGSYRGSVEEAKRVLGRMGLDSDVIELVDKDPMEVSKALQKEIDASEKDTDKDLLKDAKRVKGWLDDDFFDEKRDDFFDENQKRQLDMLGNCRFITHSKKEKMEREISEAISLAEQKGGDEQKNRKAFVEAYRDKFTRLPSSLESHEEALFKEIVQRHEANRLAYWDSQEKERIVDRTFPLYFDGRDWKDLSGLQKDNPQYRRFIPRSGFLDRCVPAALTRIVSFFRPEIATSDEDFRRNYEEIRDAHPRGKDTVGWRDNEYAGWLNEQLHKESEDGKKKLPISPPEGKKITFEVQSDFSYKDLKEAMDVRDRDDQYMPVIVAIYSYDKPTTDHRSHVAILRKLGDHYDEVGHHYVNFDMWSPHGAYRSERKYGLEDIWELSRQQLSEKGYEPGYMGKNAMVRPVLDDA